MRERTKQTKQNERTKPGERTKPIERRRPGERTKPRPSEPTKPTSSEPTKPNVRRALSHVGGETTVEGDPTRGTALVRALDVPPSEVAEEAARAHVHGFHSYPARMHPVTAQRLVESFSRPGGAVLDPFCGSGTVLVEARLVGRKAIGVDANPLAVRLAALKLRDTTEAERAAFVEAARAVALFADERRKAKSGPTRRYGPEDLALFDRHVLLELDGVRAGIDRIEDPAVRGELELVLSSMLTKLSRRTSDTSERELERRIASGYAARLFVRKAEELALRRAEASARLAAAPPARVLEGDARRLDGIGDRSVDLVVTSPPYPGVYDYLAHHEARLRWLRLRPERFERAEIGARRRLDPMGPDEGVARWEREIGDTLAALGRVMRPEGSVILLLADSVVAGRPVYSVDVIRRVAPRARLRVDTVASQPRPHFHAPTRRAFAARPRQEHAILLVRS
ncbi:DNA methyltransferase [Polyangium sp. 15x6]|uniref:DNA methyltransferase n=1 Tax=Polyangium sp. 15x6 TaxID=3042687 RepID=UPI00249B7DD8|nr:DNA methyltransferase [Polyangium sp. 15x6]MDI3286976.1 DNA methyltransferase [Polyangium sp. 15x6]